MIRRELSTQTLADLNNVVSKIKARAAVIKDDEVSTLADECNTLLVRLSMQYLIEDEQGIYLGNP